MTTVIQELPDAPLDIVGDVHGELQALCDLMGHLGYDGEGNHPDGRKLVFVGDLVDRGQDCPGVVRLVRRLMAAGNAFAVVGNHELNIVMSKPKDGTGWFLPDARQKDKKYEPYTLCPDDEREEVAQFLSSLPLALVRPDLRIVHATWDDEALEAVKTLTPEAVGPAFLEYEQAIIRRAQEENLYELATAEENSVVLEDRSVEPPFLHQLARLESLKQMGNPIKILTSGIERPGTTPFYSSGKWRFVERVQWWNEYEGSVPVVIGHYWRRVNPIDRAKVGKGDPDLFESIPAHHWHGKNKNVFCVDFSVGGRWTERASKKQGPSDFKLAALRWPEKTVLFDDGYGLPTA